MRYIPADKDPGIFQRAKLKNGITVYHRAYEQAFGLPKVACCALLTVGGRDDKPGKEGVAHFFEHMPFRGTKDYPDVRTLTQTIEDNGGYINAFTSDESTGYEVTVPTPMLEDDISRMADMLQRPLIRPADMETERLIIQEELRNRLASVNFYARRNLYKGLLHDHPIVSAVLGTEESLLGIQKKDLTNFHQHYYNASNLSLFFTGHFEPEKLIELGEKYFGALTAGPRTERQTTVETQIANYEQVLTPDRYNRSVYMLGRVLPPTSLQDSLKVQLFRGMLTWGLYSPLYEEIREKRGLAYNLSVHHHQYKDLGVLAFTVSTQFKQMDEVDRVIWEILESILDDEKRFQEVKHMLKQTLLYRDYSLESVLHEAIDEYLDYDTITPLNEQLAAIDAIHLADVKAYMASYLKKEEFLNIRVNAEGSKKGTA